MTEPFLKWAGGKRWLIQSGHLPELPKYERLVEPFLGSGAIFFHLQPTLAVLSDLNEELISTYEIVKNEPTQLCDLMRTHQKKHSPSYYYEIRASAPRSKLHRAARFLYLNRTCWNGLYRVNLRGQFNVPKGTKETVLFEDEDFLDVSKKLQVADLICSDFETIIDKTREGDLLFVDPPYTVKHNFNGFLKYNEQIFRWTDQTRLKEALVRAYKRKVSIVMTNADHKSIRDLYKGHFEKSRLARNSILAANSSDRKPTTEIMFTANI